MHQVDEKQMEFTNPQISTDNIPRASDVQFTPIEPDYLKTLRISWAILYGMLLLMVIAAIYFIPPLRKPLPLTITIATYLMLLLLTVVLGTGSFRRKSYAIREHDVLYRTGWIKRELHIVPFSRIQHAVVNSGPIDRQYGLATLALHTAASDMSDITIHGLRYEDAEGLKELIISKIKPLQTDEGVE